MPVQQRVKFKILMQVFKNLNGQSPSYLVDLISRHVPIGALRSRDPNLLAVLAPLQNLVIVDLV